MRTTSLICVFLSLILTTSGFSFDVAAVGVVDVASPAVDASEVLLPTDRKIGIGFGGLVSVYSIPGFTVEGGLLSIPRKYSLTSNPLETVTLSMIEVPLLLRFDLLPIIAAGVGAYAAFGSGEIIKDNQITTTSESYESNNLGKTDFGLMGSLSLSLPVLPTLKILVDLRYLHGLANLSTVDGASFKFRDLQLLGGLKLSL